MSNNIIRIIPFFYKEWIKTRWVVLGIAVCTLIMCAYCLLNTSRAIEIKGAAHIWEVILYRKSVLIHLLNYIPLIAGLILAIMQFTPEMQQSRLKLMLHLPCSQYKSVGSLILYGLLVLFIIFGLNLLVLTLGLKANFAPEIVSRIILTSLVWYIAGIQAYLLVVWICTEPTWKRRVVYGIMAIALLHILFLSNEPEAYNRLLPAIVVFSALLTTLPFMSVARFKSGKQD